MMLKVKLNHLRAREMSSRPSKTTKSEERQIEPSNLSRKICDELRVDHGEILCCNSSVKQKALDQG